MKVLVTGADGYIGPAVLSTLTRARVDTQSCDIGWFASARVERGAWREPDHLDFTSLSVADLASSDAVIHLAGYSNDPLGHLHPGETMRLNFHETIRLAQRARAAGVRTFVFASSCSVYGDSGAAVAQESQSLAPLTPYARSKALAEAALLELQTGSFRVAILRGATVFGASPVPRTDLLLNEFCAYAALGRSAVLNSTGESWRPFMPVGDFARALVCAATYAPANSDRRPIWNIAPPKMQRTVRDAANLTAEVAGLPRPNMAQDAPKDARSYRVDGTQFLRDFKMFDYSPDFRVQLAACMMSFERIPTLERDLAADRFIRLETVRRSSLVAQ